MTSNTNQSIKDGLERLNARITNRAMRLLQFECKRRYQLEAGRAPYGKIISELIEQKFGHHWAAIEPKGPATVTRRRLAQSA